MSKSCQCLSLMHKYLPFPPKTEGSARAGRHMAVAVSSVPFPGPKNKGGLLGAVTQPWGPQPRAQVSQPASDAPGANTLCTVPIST